MNRRPLFIAAAVSILLFGNWVRAGEAPAPAVIPKPAHMSVAPGEFTLRPGKVIEFDAGAEGTARYLSEQLQRRLGGLFGASSGSEAGQGMILLTTNGAEPFLGMEGYALEVTPQGAVIRATADSGLFHGVETFLQLLPTAQTGSRSQFAIPCVSIQDSPRFKWRGLMLDVARHFFTKQEVEHLLDEMAWYKLNVFHWHLTDDQGWRIEIKQYPRLTAMGAWRKGVGFGLDPKKTTAYGPDGRYGGFYTQDDIREVVAYAAARHIMIVPEIEMPGHASAALMAYPQYSCFGGPYTTDLPGGVFDGVYCAGNDASFTFLQNILTEVFALFPGPYIHIGGDEVRTNNWAECPKCQARMRAEGLTRNIELESYFIRRMEKFINTHHRTLVGWSEIREGGLAANAVVMDWVGGAVEAATAGHDVVMSPLDDMYFDHYQSQDHSTEPYAIGGYLPLQQVYQYEPIPTNLPSQFDAHILGAQANVWTEYMPNFQHVQYMVFPRLLALAEVDWSPKSGRDWDDFSRRARVDMRRLDELGVQHRALP